MVRLHTSLTCFVWITSGCECPKATSRAHKQRVDNAGAGAGSFNELPMNLGTGYGRKDELEPIVYLFTLKIVQTLILAVNLGHLFQTFL